MTENPISKKPIQFKFDVSTFRLLGRELITDRITALFELVKNSYDANANNVYLEFYDVNQFSNKSKIIIKDDGIGMDINDIHNHWMVVGTNSKRQRKYSSPPYNRRLVGEKGLGRFAVDKLGGKLLIETKKEDRDQKIYLEVDWKQYESLSKEYDANIATTINEDSKSTTDSGKKFFTDIDNTYWTLDTPDNSHGTTLIIELIRDIWSENDIDRASKELAKLVSPIRKLAYPFNIHIKSNEYEKFKEIQVTNKAVQHATIEKSLSFNRNENTQEVLKISGSELTVKTAPVKDFGPVAFTLYYFDQQAKTRYKKDYKGGNIDGIKIYRDGVIATPFAEYADQDIKKRDVLGIDKRRYSGFFDKVSSSDLIGILEITKDDNPKIIDATNRQDFVDNLQYRELKNFIIEQISVLEQFLKIEKDTARKNTRSELKTAKEDLKIFTSVIKEVVKERPELKKPLQTLQSQAKKIEIDVNKGIKAYNELEKEKLRQENLFLSLMSLQEYAAEIAHIVRTSLDRIARLAQFFSEEFPNEAYNDLFKDYAQDIYKEMNSLGKAVNFMLSYAESEAYFVTINLKEIIERLFNNIYKNIFEKENIQTLVEIQGSLIITHNKKFFEDIFENLIANSIKALKNKDNKIIKCSAFINQNQFILYFSDNGPGIDEVNKERVFDIYFTTTAEQGGAGIGLFVAKKRIEALKGTIEVVKSEFNPTGATFKITLPFNKG